MLFRSRSSGSFSRPGSYLQAFGEVVAVRLDPDGGGDLVDSGRGPSGLNRWRRDGHLSRNWSAGSWIDWLAASGRVAFTAKVRSSPTFWTPFGATTPYSARWARMAFESWVCWRTRKSRGPWVISTTCWATVLTGTKRMLGRVVLRLPSIPRIDGSLRERLQTLTNRFRINGIGRRENSPPDCLLFRLTATLDEELDIVLRHQVHDVGLQGQFPRPAMR